MTPEELETYLQSVVEMGGSIAERPSGSGTWYRVDVAELEENEEGTLVPVSDDE